MQPHALGHQARAPVRPARRLLLKRAARRERDSGRQPQTVTATSTLAGAWATGGSGSDPSLGRRDGRCPAPETGGTGGRGAGAMPERHPAGLGPCSCGGASGSVDGAKESGAGALNGLSGGAVDGSGGLSEGLVLADGFRAVNSPALWASDKPSADVSQSHRRPPPMRWRSNPASVSGIPSRLREARSAVGWRPAMPDIASRRPATTHGGSSA